MPRTPVGIVVLPSLGRIVTATDRGTIDSFDRALKPRGSFRVCAEPWWLVADDARGHVLVGCHDPKARADVGEGELVFVDVRSSTVIARRARVSLLTVAALDASSRNLVYARVAGGGATHGTLARFDPMTAAPVDSIAVPGSSGDRYRLVPGDGETPIVAVDRDGDRVVAIDRAGSALVRSVGRRRLPADAALDGHRLFVALSGSGSVGELELNDRTGYQAVPACDTPAAVVVDRPRHHVLAFCVGSPDGREASVVSLDDPGGRRLLRTIQLSELIAYPSDHSWAELDAPSGRMIVTTKRRVEVVDPTGTSFGIDLLHGMWIAGVALDRVSGNAYAAISDLSGGAIARVPVRGTAPRPPPAYGTGLPPPRRDDAAVTVFENDDLQPALPDPPGMRSPTALAVRPDGTLTVADRFSPTLGSFAAGVYREEPVATIAPPHDVVYDRNGSLWFSEATAADIGTIAWMTGTAADAPGTVARRDANGRITEFPLPGFASKIVVADDGIYWVSVHPSAWIVGRIAPDGTSVLRSVKLGPHAQGPRRLVDIAAAPDGGCYILYDDALVRLRPDGSQTILPEFLKPKPTMFDSGLPAAVAVLSDGSVAVALGRAIVRYTPSGARQLIQPFPDPASRHFDSGSSRGPCALYGLAGGPNASVWGACGDAIVAVPLPDPPAS